jgi:hypothetical protein
MKALLLFCLLFGQAQSPPKSIKPEPPKPNISSDELLEVTKFVSQYRKLLIIYHVIAYFDDSANEIGIVINNGTPVTTSFTSSLSGGAGNLRVMRSTADGESPDGRIDGLGVWSRVLTSDERTELYNSGTGKDYPF